MIDLSLKQMQAVGGGLVDEQVMPEVTVSGEYEGGYGGFSGITDRIPSGGGSVPKSATWVGVVAFVVDVVKDIVIDQYQQAREAEQKKAEEEARIAQEKAMAEAKARAEEQERLDAVADAVAARRGGVQK